MNHLELITIYNEALYVPTGNAASVMHRTGLFGQKVLIIVSSTDWNEAIEEFLKKVLHSCNLNDNDYLIVVSTESGNIFDLINENRPDILFLFGMKLESDFFNSKKTIYKPFVFNGIKIALCDPLNVLKSDKEKRLLLWNQCIKPLFNIN